MRAAIYLRMSLDRELGIERQREDCWALCERLGWQGIEFVDNDRSATKANVRRDSYEVMTKDLVEGNIDAIITWRSDRLYRTMRDLLPLIDMIQGQNRLGKRIGIETVQTGLIDLTTDSGRMVAKILAAVAENEGEVRTARQLRALEQVAESGRGWGQTAFGYSDDHRKPGLNEAEAEQVRQAFADLLGGATLYSIAMAWNNNGFKSRRGNAFNGTAVRRVLTNPRYAGLRSFRGKIVGKGDWPPIISEETFEAAQIILNNPARRTTDNQVRKVLLGSLAKCGSCQVGLGTSKNSSGTPIYKCKNYAGCNRGVTRKQETVDKYISGLMVDKLNRREWVSESNADASKAKGLHQDAETLRQRRDGLPAYIASGDLTPEQVREATIIIDRSLAEINNKMARLTRSHVYDGLAEIEDMEAWWTDVATIDRKRAIIQSMVANIVVEHTDVSGWAARKLPLGHGISVTWHKPGDH